MSEVWADIACYLYVYEIVDPSECDRLCLTQTYNKMECWATWQYDRRRCLLMYDVDPMFCKESHASVRRESVTFKSCYNGMLLINVLVMGSSIYIQYHNVHVYGTGALWAITFGNHIRWSMTKLLCL